jgi:excisionase family DNA binding protein
LRYISGMNELLSIPEAAEELSLHPSRVRALVAAGALPGIKIGNRWAVDRVAVARRLQGDHGAGRPFEPRNAWAVLFLASGDQPDWLGSKELWRLRRALRLEGLNALIPRLERRAKRSAFRAHPGELSHLLGDPALARSGISAAGSYALDLVSGAEADGYIRESRLSKFRRAHALEPAGIGVGNVLLRVVPDSAWHLDPHEGAAPPAAVAVDLLGAADARSQRAGRQLLKRLASA